MKHKLKAVLEFTRTAFLRMNELCICLENILRNDADSRNKNGTMKQCTPAIAYGEDAPTIGINQGVAIEVVIRDALLNHFRFIARSTAEKDPIGRDTAAFG